MSKRVLVIEDEQQITEWLDTYLTNAGYIVDIAHDGVTGLNKALKGRPDLILLDLNLPSLSGQEICQKIRNHDNPSISSVPILMLTALSGEQDLIKGLSIGADDYVAKPFKPKEIVARCDAMLRRSSGSLAPSNKLSDGDLVLELDSRRVTLGEKNVDLTPNEFMILATFLRSRDKVLTREQLIELAFGFDYEGTERTIDVYIRSLRRKIEVDPNKPQRITTVFGVGYRYVPQY